jgi:alkylmercury lyase
VTGLPAIRKAAFLRLYRDGAPVTAAMLASDLGRDEPAVRSDLDLLDSQGKLRRLEGGVVGVGGLSLVPSRHEIVVDGRRFWTWCAYDAIGILAALGRGGVAISTSPVTGRRLEVRFAGAVPTDPEPAVFLANRSNCRSVVDDWCPLNNLFENAETARGWAAAEAVEGAVLGVVETAELGGERWRRMFEPAPA